MGPNYPIYPTQPYTGNLPTMQEVGPSDWRYTSGTAPYYQQKIDRLYGRTLAGTEVEVQDEGAHAEPGTAGGELEQYAEMDDVQGSGIFDPPGSHPNIHPDAGVFASRMSLPGYHAREIPFSDTEIIDVTTGRPVRAVPSGAVAMDSAAEVAFIEQGVYGPPRPVLIAQDETPMGLRSITNVFQNPQPIGQTESKMNTWQLFAAAAALGLAVGGAVALFWPKKKQRA